MQSKVRPWFIILCLMLSAHPGLAGEFDIKNYQGKVVLVDFWASWCSSCLKSFPWINHLVKHYSSDKFIVVSINVDDDAKPAQKALKKHPLQSKQIMDNQFTLANQYKVKALPASFLYDASGKLDNHYSGYNKNEKEDIEKDIARLISISK